MLYGYCRCATDEKGMGIELQERELIARGVDPKNIYKECASGIKRDRAELNRLLDVVEAGDTIIAKDLSRVTRSQEHLMDILRIAKEKRLKLILGSFERDYSKDNLGSNIGLECFIDDLRKLAVK